jgi:hypothetical protein
VHPGRENYCFFLERPPPDGKRCKHNDVHHDYPGRRCWDGCSKYSE